MHGIVIDENKPVIANIDTRERERTGELSFRYSNPLSPYSNPPSLSVMTLCGLDLLNLTYRLKKPLKHCTVSRIGIMSLSAIKQLHEAGFVHRDIKPGNFVAGSRNGSEARVLYLIDFGEKMFLEKSNDGRIRSHPIVSSHNEGRED